MEITIVERDGELVNPKLKTCVNNIKKAHGKITSAYQTVGTELKKIKDGELYKDDFESFSDCVTELFNISQAQAYRIIAVCEKFLIPECGREDKFFESFNDTALAALRSVGGYDEVKDFCMNHCINETSSVREINEIIRSNKNVSRGTISEGLNVDDLLQNVKDLIAAYKAENSVVTFKDFVNDVKSTLKITMKEVLTWD